MPKGKREEKKGGLKTFAAPRGSKEVKGLFGTFWNPERPGDSITGVLVGTTPIENRKGKKINRYVLMTEDGDIKTLPDHIDLVGKLQRLKDFSRVYIEYLGREPVTTRRRGAVSMLRYGVADFGVTEGGASLAEAALRR